MKYLISLTSALLFSSTAFAADAIVYTEPTPIAAVEGISWTGAYIGANAGYAWTNGSPVKNQALYWGTDLQPLEQEDTSNKGSFTGGFQLGYNYQYNNMVFGLEADLNLVNAKNKYEGYGDRLDQADPAKMDHDVHLKVDNKLSWYGTLRPKAGMLLNDRTLVYITGGLAYGKVKTTVNSALYEDWLPGIPSENQYHYSDEDRVFKNSRLGWTLGAGVEYALTEKLNLKAEYLYVDLGKKSIKEEFPTYSAVHYEFKSKMQLSTLRLGVNYKF